MKTIFDSVLRSDRLDEMHYGTVELSVPLVDGVIQIGAGGDLEMGRIRVCKSRDRVLVEAVDGSPMQVELVTDGRAKSAVFRRPVAVLRLRRICDINGQAVWWPSGFRNVTRMRRVKQFVDTIGTFGAAKQRRTAVVVPSVAGAPD